MGNDGEVEKIGLYYHFCSTPCDKGRFERWLEGLERETSLRSGGGPLFDALYIGN